MYGVVVHRRLPTSSSIKTNSRLRSAGCSDQFFRFGGRRTLTRRSCIYHSTDIVGAEAGFLGNNTFTGALPHAAVPARSTLQLYSTRALTLSTPFVVLPLSCGAIKRNIKQRTRFIILVSNECGRSRRYQPVGQARMGADMSSRWEFCKTHIFRTCFLCFGRKFERRTSFRGL